MGIRASLKWYNSRPLLYNSCPKSIHSVLIAVSNFKNYLGISTSSSLNPYYSNGKNKHKSIPLTKEVCMIQHRSIRTPHFAANSNWVSVSPLPNQANQNSLTLIRENLYCPFEAWNLFLSVERGVWRFKAGRHWCHLVSGKESRERSQYGKDGEMDSIKMTKMSKTCSRMLPELLPKAAPPTLTLFLEFLTM